MSPTCFPDPPDRPAGPRPAETTEVASVPLRRLQGRNVGILIGDPGGLHAMALRNAAEGLGARVSLVKFQTDAPPDEATLERTARVLARLYDAVVCVDLPPLMTARLREVANIPLLGLDALSCAAVEASRERLLVQLSNLFA